MPEGVSVSADGLAVSRAGSAGWRGALVEPVFSSAERCYAEWVIDEADTYCHIMIGVTDVDAAPPAGEDMYDMPGSRMYYCLDSEAYPDGRNWGVTGRRVPGDRVGLLVERGCMSVYVNGARLGQGPISTDLPQKVCPTFAVTHLHVLTAPKTRTARDGVHAHCSSGCSIAVVHAHP